VQRKQITAIFLARPAARIAGPEGDVMADHSARPSLDHLRGSPDLRRLRAGRYRVFYTIDEERRVIQIDHVARLP